MLPTPEQTAITESFTAGPCLVITAGPGTGKSTTLGMGVRTLPKPWWPVCRGVAFNKDAAEALQAKMPMIKVSTLNSLGLGVWTKYLEKDYLGKPNTKKNREIINEVRANGRWSIPSEEIPDILDLMSAAKTQGYLPRGCGGVFQSSPSYDQLVRYAGVAHLPGVYREILDIALKASINLAFQGECDFDDQIYMSTCFAPSEAFEAYKVFVVDEAQDLSPLQLHLLRRFNAKHYVFVGDPLQAIYAFRGAMSDAMDRIYDIWPSALTLPLQTSFRLPRQIVELLNPHNPELTTVKEDEGDVGICSHTGTIDDLITWGSPAGTKAILCRNNAPLFKIALACIASRVPFTMANKAFGLGLIKDIQHVCRSTGLRNAPATWVCAQLYTRWFYSDPQGQERANLLDKYDTVVALAERCTTGESMCLEITSLNRQANASDKLHPLFLSTAHKAKGLEFDWVCHLDPNLIPSKFAKTPEELQQESNIAYVINSRSLHTLVFLNSDQILIPGAPTRQPRPRTRYQEQI